MAGGSSHRISDHECTMTGASTEPTNTDPSNNGSILSLTEEFHEDIKNHSSYMSAFSDEDDSSSDGSGPKLRSLDPSADDANSEVEMLTGRKDTQMAKRLRIVVVSLFVNLGIWCPIVLYVIMHGFEKDKFEEDFHSSATMVVESVVNSLLRKLGAIDTLSIAVLSHAIDSNSSWPFVTIPDFDLRANSVRNLGELLSVTLHPFVNHNDRSAWEEYSEQNSEWVHISDQRSEVGLFNLEEIAILPSWSKNWSSQKIFTFHETDGLVMDQPGIDYLPHWQSMPPQPGIVNLNDFKRDRFGAAMEALMTKNVTISPAETLYGKDGPQANSEILMDEYYREVEHNFHGEGHVPTTHALATMYYPVFDSLDPETRQVAGLISAVIDFELFFSGVFPEGDNMTALDAVVENCNNVFTYTIKGHTATFRGAEDLHSNDFDDGLKKEVYFNDTCQKTAFEYGNRRVYMATEYCPYVLRLYPHRSMREKHVTNRPTNFALSAFLVVVFICITSVLYDFYVQRRMRSAIKSAQENRAIVSSLFPANVRDRLLKEEEERKRAEDPRRRNSMSSRRSNDNSSRRYSNEGNRRNSNEGRSRRNSNETGHNSGITDYFPFSIALTSLALAPAKLRLKFFLSGGESPEPEHEYPAEIQEDPSGVAPDTKPIADLFPNCTVLFADISGFTAWSSEREPEQVFTLLQTIFQKFDQLARKRDIFKVETIGDCYVAVTGLPDPQEDHAVRMAKFSRACMHKVSLITKRLEISLGPGTADLRMRFGMNSGPVTAGVLRGEKSRFQLFGDTVNTASRMESTGQRNKIQISQSTADCLTTAGKQNWIQAREDVVHAKGKGPVQTYWILTRRTSPSVDGGFERPKFIQSTLQDSASDLESIESDSGSVWGEDEGFEDAGSAELPLDAIGQRGYFERLVDWQVDLLLRLLKQVVAGREEETVPLENPNEVMLRKSAVLDEVAESIELPKFDPKAARARASRTMVQVPDKAVAELRDYVRTIANRYRRNPFHNFAHASHVTMSANKLLSRIVKPEDVNYHRTSVKAIASDLHDYTYGITSDPLTQFAIMLSTLVHDVDHTGVSNTQRGLEDPDMADRCQHRSVSEQNSVEIAWDLLMDSKYKHLQQCLFSNKAEVIRFRQLLVNLVLATDIFDKKMKKTRDMRWGKVFHSEMKLPMPDDELRNLKATIVIEHIIQAADVAHTMQHWQVYSKWNECLFQEMYLAYNERRSPLDPSKGWYLGELLFFDNYVIPLARKLEGCGVFGASSDECLNYALENRREWAVKGGQMVAEMVERAKRKRLSEFQAPFVLEFEANDYATNKNVSKSRHLAADESGEEKKREHSEIPAGVQAATDLKSDSAVDALATSEKDRQLVADIPTSPRPRNGDTVGLQVDIENQLSDIDSDTETAGTPTEQDTSMSVSSIQTPLMTPLGTPSAWAGTPVKLGALQMPNEMYASSGFDTDDDDDDDMIVEA